VDWHGHRDRGLSIANSLAALAAGADQIHGAALSLGERVGNTPMELLLVNLRLLGLIQNELTALPAYCEKIAAATHTAIPPNYPVFGRDAFRTATGVHAAAIVKALNKHDAILANSVYSGVPAHLFGLEQIVEVGPMSGKSNVLHWLSRHKITANDDIVAQIVAAAKQSLRVLTDQELHAICAASGAKSSAEA
jgi:isopropylmalate/homocitrate/citramalate synthase